jgi:hypothetical protein
MNSYLQHIDAVTSEDAAGLKKAEQSYGDSWKKRGGVGAFMMLARKWDRLEKQVEKNGWDVFSAAKADNRTEGLIDDIRDLRRYLALVEAELRAQGTISATAIHRDNQPK